MKYFVVVPNQVDGAPAGFGHGLQVFPNALAGIGIQAAKLAVTVDAVDVISLQNGRADHAVQAFGMLLVTADFSPNALDAGRPTHLKSVQSISEPS